VVSVVDAESLVFSAYEYSADDIASNEKKQEAVVEAGMVVSVEDRQQNQSCRTGDGEDD